MKYVTNCSSDAWFMIHANYIKEAHDHLEEYYTSQHNKQYFIKTIIDSQWFGSVLHASMTNIFGFFSSKFPFPFRRLKVFFCIYFWTTFLFDVSKIQTGSKQFYFIFFLFHQIFACKLEARSHNSFGVIKIAKFKKLKFCRSISEILWTWLYRSFAHFNWH